MDLPDCPPGAEGYQDTVVEVPKKLELEGGTKAEQEFLQHLNSLKIKVEDGSVRCMVDRRGRDISGKWIYLCFPCAAQCSGESVLQTHISGKKHKAKLSLKNVWPKSIFDEHPYILSERGASKNGATSKVLQKMREEVNLHNSPLSQKYDHYRDVRCHIQDILDETKAPLLGVEYLIEHPPEEAHHEPMYICVLCFKQGHPRTIVNHLTCYSHRINYLNQHFPKANKALQPYRAQNQYRTGVNMVLNRLAQCIEHKYGRMRPVNFQKDEYDRHKDEIHKWIYKGPHFAETEECTFEEVIDADLISSLNNISDNRDPSPPAVAAPSRPRYRARPEFNRELSTELLSDISDDDDYRKRGRNRNARYSPPKIDRHINLANQRQRQKRVGNLEYKVIRAKELTDEAEEAAKKMLAYHEKNPEKHPLYPEEWKKFWNRRYKELQAEGKDPSKHDFKPEWIKFWTARMKELHDEELRITVHEIYRKFSLAQPDDHPLKADKDSSRHVPERKRSISPRKRSPTYRKVSRFRSPERRHSVERRKSLERRRSVERRKSPERRRSPDRRKSPERRRSIDRRRSPDRRISMERKRSPGRQSPFISRFKIIRNTGESDHMSKERVVSPPRRRSPLRLLRTRSRSPVKRRSSPLSERDARTSPGRRNPTPPQIAPSMQTVLISDDELKPDGASPWDSDDSLGSLPEVRSPGVRMRSRSRAASRSSRASHASHAKRTPQDYKDLTGSADNIVATLRMLVALEDHLGSLGPKIVDLLAQAIRMEKEKPNSSEDLLELESAVVLIETAKEKLKGALQAGLVSGSTAAALRAAVVRAAATLHEADTRTRNKQKDEGWKASKAAKSGVPVAGVGEVDREEIAQQMAAALVAQGKTDVSSEELAQLVDAVVGMAEAKKREAKLREQARSMEHKNNADDATAASALQLLQSAYDDKTVKRTAEGIAYQPHRKKYRSRRRPRRRPKQPALIAPETKVEKDEAVADAMDGLSDSDLETLLKNFNELSAEEQHSLIAYLKKLEAREPTRVERLRQYVSADAVEVTPVQETTPAPAANATAPPAALSKDTEDSVKPVTIESDDDDYTVEEVFESATKKVKEDQIRQEMEIVKKSLENKSPPPDEKNKPLPGFDYTQNFSSASDLLALVQASIQSQSANTAPPVVQVADVTPTTSVQPRSFGDAPEQVDNRKSYDLPIQSLPASQPVWDNSYSNQSTTPIPIQSNYNQPRPQNSSYNNNLVSLGNVNNFNQPPNMSYNQGQNYHDSYDSRGNFNAPYQGQPGNQYNHNQRGGFSNSGIRDNITHNQQYGNRPQYGNYDQNNFRGRGRGFGGGRGRGRGYY